LGFFVVNPLATLALSIYLGGILFLLQRVFTIRSQRQSRVRSAASISLLEATRSYRNTVNEANLAGKTQYWIQAISTQKLVWAQSTIRLNIYAGFPRYVIESALILGIFLFTAAVVTFSDIPSQALTLGVFLTGGLRIVASLLPFQSALAAFSQNRAAGEPALTALETARVPIVLNESETASSRKVPKATVPTISVTDVKVVSNEGKTLLDGVTFEVPFGAKVAIIGPSGAGKTTLLRAMLGFEPLADGRVSYGGVDPESYWSQHPGSISYVPQRPFLFSGSARENIELGEQVAKNHFDSVISSCGLEDVIENDAKLDSPGGAPGVEYSGGETQRIGLARALISQPEVLFLDEATSALDIRSEQAISNTIDALRGNCTVIIVAHRLPTVRNSDLVIYLENGKVRASGTFDDVVARIPDLQKNSAIVD
jgi:ABC-type bacteriocin/lantibiotic exporter with double-glycine peptidase domain